MMAFYWVLRSISHGHLWEREETAAGLSVGIKQNDGSSLTKFQAA